MTVVRLAALAALTLALSAPSASAESTVVASGFEDAFGLATGADGNIYVADQAGVTKLSPDGTRLAQYPATIGARDVAVDAEGNVYAAVWGGANWLRVRKTLPNGQTAWTTGSFLGGSGLAVAGGKVFVTDRDHLEMLDATDGAALGASESLSRPGDNGWLSDVTARGNRVFAVTSGRLHELDLAGADVASSAVGQSATARVDLGADNRIRIGFWDSAIEIYDTSRAWVGTRNQGTRGVAESGDSVYVVSGGTRVLRYDKSTELTDPSPEPTPDVTPTPTPDAPADTQVVAGGFKDAFNLTAGADGHLYVADAEGVTKLATDGSRLAEYPATSGARDVAVDADGNLYAAVWGGANWLQVRKILPGGQTAWTTGQFLGGQAVAVAAGKVFVTDRDHLEMLDAATGVAVGASEKLSRPGDRHWVTDVAVRGGRVFAVANGRLHELDLAGAELGSAPIAHNEWARLDLGADDRIRISYADSRIEVYDTSRAFLGSRNQKTHGVAELGDSVYVVSGGTQVLRYPKSSEFAYPAPTPTPTPSVTPTSTATPSVTPTPTPTPEVVVAPVRGLIVSPLPVATPAPATPPTPQQFGAVSINGGDLYTNDPQVRLSVTAPLGATSALVANDGGFAAGRSFNVFGSVSWKLAESAGERLPKTVYVRFLPGGQTLQDDIILDQTAPVLTTARADRSGARYTLRLKASDRTSGIAGAELVVGKKRTSLAYKAKSKVRLPEGKVSVRVRDGAGNWSRAKRIK